MYRPTRDEVGMVNAMTAALRSTCGRKAVGAHIAHEGRPIGSGYAGPPSGEPHCDLECLKSHQCGCRRTIHAEQNALAWAARRGLSTAGATMYVTLSPCWECAGLIINSGIVQVKYLEPYRNPEGIERLIKNGIPCEIQTVNSAIFRNLHLLSVCGGDPASLE